MVVGGYGLVNVVTKTGGNEFHGDLYEINGIDKADARNFFDNARAPFKQNVFGFTIDGKVTPLGCQPSQDQTHCQDRHGEDPGVWLIDK